MTELGQPSRRRVAAPSTVGEDVRRGCVGGQRRGRKGVSGLVQRRVIDGYSSTIRRTGAMPLASSCAKTIARMTGGIRTPSRREGRLRHQAIAHQLGHRTTAMVQTVYGRYSPTAADYKRSQTVGLTVASEDSMGFGPEAAHDRAGLTLCMLMPGPGLEPGLPCGKGILSPSRLPVSPSRRTNAKANANRVEARTASSTLVFLRAGNGTRTRDPNLGKVVLYQLSYSRVRRKYIERRLIKGVRRVT